MQKLLSLINAILVVLVNQLSVAQCFIDSPPVFPPPQNGGGGNQMMAPYASKNGWYLPASGEIRILFVFYEVNYTGGTDPTPPIGNPGWPAHQLPNWKDSIADAFNPGSNPATGMLTRYFQLASSGRFTVLGDYLLAPNNGGIFSVNSSTGNVNPSHAIAAVNAAMGTNIVTGNGLNSINDFDKWTTGTSATGPGQVKITPSTESPRKYDHVMFICRNSRDAKGDMNNGTGYAWFALPSFMLGFQANTHSSFGAYDGLPFNIIRHEFSHLIYGGNNFHCGGGGTGPENYWIPLIGGWSNLSLYNGSLNSWNAWDRQRLDWKAPGSTFEVAARDQNNTAFVNGDLDATNPNQAGIYTLRDFVNYGDALRIKLPFTDPVKEYPMFLWIENHQGRNVNGVPFDKWLYEADYECVAPVVPGLYAYMQVDKEVRSDSTYSKVYSGYADYLRPITADGFWDRENEIDPVFNPCVQYGYTKAFIKKQPNPLSGGGDQEFNAQDLDNNNVITGNEHNENKTEKVGNNYFSNQYTTGHSRHSFTLNSNKKIGMGTNPSSASMMNLVSWDDAFQGAKNLRWIYLNGISIEILSQASGNIQVEVRFDDVNVSNDTRWCADTIVLNHIPSPLGYSLNLSAGKTIHLDRGLSATRMDIPEQFNGLKLFNSSTRFWILDQATVHLEQNSTIDVDNGSMLHQHPGSRIEIEAGAMIKVRNGSVFLCCQVFHLTVKSFCVARISPLGLSMYMGL